MFKKKNWMASIITVLAVVFGMSAIASAQNDSAKLIFSGVKMETAAGDSVQGFLDFSVKDIENNGVSFTLEYNTDYVQLSNVSDNTPITESSQINGIPGFMVMNNGILPDEFWYVLGEQNPNDGKYGNIEINIAVKNGAPQGEFVGTKTLGEGFDEPYSIIKAANRKVKLGSLSFRIVDPAGFAKLSDAELMKVFRIKTTDNGSSVFVIDYADTTSYPPLLFYDQSQYLGYEFEIENPISSVIVNKANDKTINTVNAAEIFRYGNETDLIDYLNAYMKDVTVMYSDTTQIADTVRWGDYDKGYTCSEQWNPKGGKTYTVRQRYNDEFWISADVTVTPVILKGYICDNDAVNYPTAADVPSSLADEAMQLPTKAKPVFDTVVPSMVNYEVDIENDWEQTSPAAVDFFADKQPDITYIFEATVQSANLPIWVTYDSDLKVSIERSIGEATPAPEETRISASVDENGVLTINVGSVGGISPIPSDMNFIVRMPNGEIIDPKEVTDAGGTFSIEPNSPGIGNATITIKAGNRNVPSQDTLAKYINLGDRAATSFGLAAKDGNKPRSSFTDFTFEARLNKYTGTNHIFDYSASRASLFAFDESMVAPSLTITLAGGDTVPTVYSGIDGSEPGALGTIKVINWAKDATEIKAGNIVTFTGILDGDANYTNWGKVKNPDNVTVTIKVLVSETPEDREMIADIDNIVFDKRQVGYRADDVHEYMFSLTNIGNINILGLTVSIDSDDFVLGGTPSYSLLPGASDTLTIKPKTGLPVGVYTANVTVSSNRTAELDTFTLTFEVTESPVYDLMLSVYDIDAGTNSISAGTATAPGGYSYAAGDTVTISAIANEDYNFVNWEVLRGGLTSDSFTPVDGDETTVTFVMPDLSGMPIDSQYVSIRANFSQGERALLRLSDLKVTEPDDTENDLLDESYKKIAFDMGITEYNVVVGSASEQNKAQVRLIPEATADGVTVNVTASIKNGDSAVQTLNVTPRANETGAYDIELFNLETAPAENILTVTLTTGSVSRDYTVKIYRKKARSELVSFGYGNSPYGLIMNDDNIPETDKNAWKEAFDAAKNSFTEGFTPQGGITGLHYYTDAWGADGAANYDKDDSAIFAYCGDTFKDPGILSLTNSLGEEVTIDNVTRSVSLQRLADTPAANLTLDLSSVTEEVHQLNSDITADETVLAGGRVRPGVYAIQYVFRDYDGSRIVLTKPLIVLYERGDVNLSKSVTNDDAELIAGRYRTKLPYGNLPGYEAGSRLCLYRICDANTDRNINIGDYNYIIKVLGNAQRFYPSL